MQPAGQGGYTYGQVTGTGTAQERRASAGRAVHSPVPGSSKGAEWAAGIGYEYDPTTGTWQRVQDRPWDLDDKGMGMGQQWGQDAVGRYGAADKGARQMQLDALSGIGAAARGEVPSAAELQMQAGLQRALAGQMAMSKSDRGARTGGQSSALGMQLADTQLGVAGQTAQLRADEQARAREMYMTGTGQAREQGLQLQALIEQSISDYMAKGMTYDEANRQARMEAASLQAQIALGQMQSGAQKEGAAYQAGATGLAALAQIASSASDIRVKTNIGSADASTAEMLDALAAYEFDYKDPKHGGKKNTGIMAQDLEKSEAGRAMIVDMDGMKGVDLRRATMAALASAAHLNKRLRALEGGR